MCLLKRDLIVYFVFIDWRRICRNIKVGQILFVIWKIKKKNIHVKTIYKKHLFVIGNEGTQHCNISVQLKPY